jgi:Tol biopolymer transport system component
MDPQTGNWDVWTIDLARGIPSRATFDAAVDSDAVWSPDGRQIVFASRRGGQLGLYRKTLGGDHEEALALFPDALQLVPSDWSPDERFILFTIWNRSGLHEIRALPLQGDRRSEVLVRGRPLAYGARVSPDGRWIAYSGLDTGKMEIYVQPFRASGETRQISSGGGVHPRWTGDGREIVYWAEPKGLMSVTLTPAAAGFSAAAPRPVLDVPIVLLIDSRTPWDMTRDGRRFLVRRASGSAQPSITVIVNWIERLRGGASPPG